MKRWTIITGSIAAMWLLILILPSFIEVVIGLALLSGLFAMLQWLNERKEPV